MPYMTWGESNRLYRLYDRHTRGIVQLTEMQKHIVLTTIALHQSKMDVPDWQMRDLSEIYKTTGQ